VKAMLRSIVIVCAGIGAMIGGLLAYRSWVRVKVASRVTHPDLYEPERPFPEDPAPR